jgi:hypothetical protein
MDRPIQALPSRRRRHLFEWEDQPWLPYSPRNIVPDHLRHVFASERAVSLRETVVDVLEGPLRRSGATHIVDVCSGGGGPLPAVMEGLERRIGKQLTATLTDLYPNATAFAQISAQTNGAVQGHSRCVSAFDVPADLGVFETLFTAFHHFKPDDAKRILVDAAAKRRTIVIIEPFERANGPIPSQFRQLCSRGMARCPVCGPMSPARCCRLRMRPCQAAIVGMLAEDPFPARQPSSALHT